MRQIVVIVIWMTIALTLPSECQQKSHQPMSNRDVLAMVKNGIPESVIVGAIQTDQTDFDLSATALIALKKAGVSKNIMEAMIAASKRGPGMAAEGVASAGANTATAASPAWHPMVVYLKGKSKLKLAPEATQIATTKTKPTSLAALAVDASLNQALQVGKQVAQNALLKSGSVAGSTAFSSTTSVIGDIWNRRKQQAPQQQKVTYVWALSGASSANVIAGNTADLEVIYSGLPGVNADQFEPVIVKLTNTTDAKFRLVGATEAATNVSQDQQHDWPIYSSFVEDRVPVKVSKLGSGHSRIIPATGLTSGQYAVALRPIDKRHKFSGEEVGKDQGEGLLFNYVWSFSVQ